jgi:hypothetical protein
VKVSVIRLEIERLALRFRESALPSVEKKRRDVDETHGLALDPARGNPRSSKNEGYVKGLLVHQGAMLVLPVVSQPLAVIRGYYDESGTEEPLVAQGADEAANLRVRVCNLARVALAGERIRRVIGCVRIV